MSLADLIKTLEHAPDSTPVILKDTAKKITAILQAASDYKGPEEKSTGKYLDLIIVISSSEKKLIAKPENAAALPALTEQLKQHLALKYDTKDLKDNPVKTSIHGFLALSNKPEELAWIKTLEQINEILLPLHPLTLNKQRQAELAELRNKFNTIIGIGNNSTHNYQHVKKDVAKLKAIDEEKIPASLMQWKTLMKETVLPENSVDAAVAKSFTILKTFVAYSPEPNEQQEAALACAILARYHLKNDAEVYGCFYRVAMSTGVNIDSQLFAIHEINKFIFEKIKIHFGFAVKDKLKDRAANTFCLTDPDFLPAQKPLAEKIYFLLGAALPVISLENKLNILLNTLLDTAYILDPANASDIAQGYKPISQTQLEALQKLLPAAIAKKARELIRQEYSPPNGGDQIAKELALNTLADQLDHISAHSNKSFATVIIDAVNTANNDHLKLFSGKKTLNFFLTILKAADILNGGQQLVGLKNSVLREARGEKPKPIAQEITKHGGPLGSKTAATPAPIITAASKPPNTVTAVHVKK